MERPREFGSSSPKMQAQRWEDDVYRKRLKNERVTRFLPSEIAKQLDNAGMHYADDLRSRPLTDIFQALSGAGPVKLREALEKVRRVERNSDLLSAYRKARSIITSKAKTNPEHNAKYLVVGSWIEKRPRHA